MNSFFSGNQRSYVDFKKQVSPKIQSLFESLREYCFSLGSDVVEDVRMHRIVFCKTITFRWFADLEPREDVVIIKIQKNRKESIQILKLRSNDQIDNVKNLLKEAFNTIR